MSEETGKSNVGSGMGGGYGEQESGVPGGWGAEAGEVSSGEGVPSQSSEGTYTDASGRQTSTPPPGAVDAPGDFQRKAQQIGLGASAAQVEQRFSREDALKRGEGFRQEFQPGAERLLRSETAQFAPGARQALYEKVSLRNPDIRPATVYRPYQNDLPGINKQVLPESVRTLPKRSLPPETQTNIDAFSARQEAIRAKYEGAGKVVDVWAGESPYKQFAGERLKNFMGLGELGETAVNVGRFGIQEPRELKRSLPSFEQTTEGTKETLIAGFVTPIKEKGLVGAAGIAADFAVLYGVGKGLGKAGSAFKGRPEVPLYRKMFGGEYTSKPITPTENIPMYRKMFGTQPGTAMTEPAPFSELKKGWIPKSKEMFGQAGGKGYPITIGVKPTETTTQRYGDIRITGSPERLMEVRRFSNVGEERNILVGQQGGRETATLQYGEFQITGYKSELIDLKKFDIKSPVRIDMERIESGKTDTGYIGGKQSETVTQQYGGFTVKAPRNRMITVSELEMEPPKPSQSIDKYRRGSLKGIFSKEGLKDFMSDESGKLSMIPQKSKPNLGESAFQVLKPRGRRVYYDEPHYIRTPRQGTPVRIVPVTFETTKEIQSERIQTGFKTDLGTSYKPIQYERLRTPERINIDTGQSVRTDMEVRTITETALKQEQKTVQRQEQALRTKFRELQRPRQKPPREPPRLKPSFDSSTKQKSAKKQKKETLFGFREYTNPIHSLEGFEKAVKKSKIKWS